MSMPGGIVYRHGPDEPRAPMRPRTPHLIVALMALALATGLLSAPGMLAFLVVVLVVAVVQLRRWRRWARWQSEHAAHWRPTGLLLDRGPISTADAQRIKQEWLARRNYVVMLDGPAERVEIHRPSDPLAVAPELRDPLWSETVGQIRADRTELLGRRSMCQERVRLWWAAGPADYGPDLDVRDEYSSARRELAEIDHEIEVAKTMSTYPYTGGSRIVDDTSWRDVPRNATVRLPRGTHAACDCRFGHYAYHQIVSASEGAAVRQCDVCSPPTRWVEVGAEAGDGA
jgi:hypothetical protein